MRSFLKTFRAQIILRVGLIAISIYAFNAFLLPTKLFITVFVVVLGILYQVYALIRYVENTNLHLSRFLLSVKHEDFSSTFSGKALGSSFEELFNTFNSIIEKFLLSRSENEEQYHYLQTVVSHIGIGLIVFQPDGNVEMINKAARKLLKVMDLKDIHHLHTLSKPLTEAILSLSNGEKALVKIESEDMELALHAAEFQLKDQKYTLVSLQNIQSELQEKEMEAWQKLIRVLTHEIMNSMTPITSMTSTIIDLLNSIQLQEPENPGKMIDNETLEDFSDALKTIHKRSVGLTEFVNSYRNLTLIPKPNFKLFPIEELFKRIEKFMENKLTEKNIRFTWTIDPITLDLTADPALIEQVLINLTLNATDALSEIHTRERLIRLTANMNESGRVVIRFIDNGPGFAEEALKKVFTPFFTTKKKGSGIGLNLSREIMKRHKGSLTVHSEQDVETVFTLRF